MVFPNICLFYTKICSSLRSTKKPAVNDRLVKCNTLKGHLKSYDICFYIIPANTDAPITVSNPATAMARLLMAPSTGAKLHGFGCSDSMGRCSKSKTSCNRLLDLCDLVDNLCDHISQNSCDDDHSNGDGHDTAKLLGNTHSDSSCDRLRKHGDIFLMIKAKQFRHKQNAAKPGQRSEKIPAATALRFFSVRWICS